jgi:hypothetical protein
VKEDVKVKEDEEVEEEEEEDTQCWLSACSHRPPCLVRLQAPILPELVDDPLLLEDVRVLLGLREILRHHAVDRGHQGVGVQVETESRICKRFIIICLKARIPSAVNMGSPWGQPGVSLRSIWGQPGVNQGSSVKTIPATTEHNHCGCHPNVTPIQCADHRLGKLAPPCQ